METGDEIKAHSDLFKVRQLQLAEAKKQILSLKSIEKLKSLEVKISHIVTCRCSLIYLFVPVLKEGSQAGKKAERWKEGRDEEMKG